MSILFRPLFIKSRTIRQRISGITLLETLISCTLTIVILTICFSFISSYLNFSERLELALKEQSELNLAIDQVRETLLSGEVQPGTTAEQLIIKDNIERLITFSLKNNKFCMYKNGTFYLTTDDLQIKQLNFNYATLAKIDSVDITLQNSRTYKLLL